MCCSDEDHTEFAIDNTSESDDTAAVIEALGNWQPPDDPFRRESTAVERVAHVMDAICRSYRVAGVDGWLHRWSGGASLPVEDVVRGRSDLRSLPGVHAVISDAYELLVRLVRRSDDAEAMFQPLTSAEADLLQDARAAWGQFLTETISLQPPTQAPPKRVASEFDDLEITIVDGGGLEVRSTTHPHEVAEFGAGTEELKFFGAVLAAGHVGTSFSTLRKHGFSVADLSQIQRRINNKLKKIGYKSLKAKLLRE